MEHYSRLTARRAPAIAALLALMSTVAGVVVANTAVAQTVPVVTVTANAERVYERETVTFTIRMDPAPTKQTRVKYLVSDRYDAVAKSREGHKSVTFQPNQAIQTISIPTQELVYTYNVQGAGRGGLPKQVPCQRPGGELPDVPSEKPASGLWSSLTAEQFNTLRDVCNALRLGATMGDVSVVIALPGDSGGYTRGSPRTAYTDVRDKSLKSSDPKPPPVVSIAAGSGVVEGGDAVFTVTADPAPSSALTVGVTVSQSGDFGVTTGSRQVTVSTSGSATLTVSTTGDSTDEANGSVTAVVGAGTGYTVSAAKGSATVTIADDDDPPVVVPDVSFGSSVYSGGEGSGSRSVSVGLVLSAAAPSGGLVVSYQVGGSAVAGSDYSSLSGSVTFVQGSSSAAIAVSVTDDAVDDDAETIVLTLVDGAAYDLGTPSSTTITIADDDDPPSPKPDTQQENKDIRQEDKRDTNPGANPRTQGSQGLVPSSAHYVAVELPPVEVTIAQEAGQAILEGEAAEFTVSYEHPMRLTVRALLDVVGDASLGTDYQLGYRLSDAEAWVSLGSDPESLAIDLPTPGGEVRVRVVSLHLGTVGTDIPLAVTVSDRSFVKSLALEVEPNGEASITLRGSGSDGTESDSSDDQRSNPDSGPDDPPTPVQASDSGDGTDNEDPQSDGSESVGAEQQAGAGTDQAQHFLTYAVKPGDTLESIAQMAYGDATAWERIFEANRGRVQNDGYTFTSSDSIRYGWVLDIPATVLVAGASSASSAPYASYTVESGDSLGAVSLKAYGDAGYWSRIEAANMGRRQADGRRFTDADSIEVGWVLRIPLGG